ncbi:elongation factor P--(R)-beta-lysine ligase [Pseudoalteromonas sp. Hal040]|jgi:lysyl-tRNA synthetase class 2|uniref:Elongation factor P--(R)-beta-lysine ligase n=1 Tax=Pseudoalteromonas gelatinilytica TaxID=1703256 RepID=A0A3A3EFR0_9GAMM|nr:elongation factor P--(R)-beta-lysine ligase [Pseudoalteromonas profundi]RJF33779.1 elongation factor P--(R)-beta-lysine ligase [Pseudoalteromonas profundi]GGE91159.1 elongation factor P--(R)-beta-lysine ligase [Pseudoalteromonas profundi]
MSNVLWQPSADIETLRERAAIIRRIREFFYARDVMEVETPSLSAASVTDVHLATFSTEFVGPGHAGGLPLYLQTSPEFAMKRLLAAGSGAIFQLCKAFRNEEAGSHHNPEFTMLEWYRPGFDEFALMDEMDELMQLVLGVDSAERLTYQQAFINALGVDPLTADISTLQQLAAEQGFADIAANETHRDTLLQLLFCMKVEPTIGQEKPCFVYHFPASQAALAQICQHDERVAGRFELYFKNMELANGFNELTNGKEQAARFSEDNQYREANGLKQVPMDERLIAALEHGLPQCAGVALGIDRLIMLATNKQKIKDVLAFDVERA